MVGNVGVPHARVASKTPMMMTADRRWVRKFLQELVLLIYFSVCAGAYGYRLSFPSGIYQS